MTLIREALNTWIPAYLVDTHHVAPGTAAEYSSLFPFIGGLSALGIGLLSDRLTSGNRVALIVPTMGLCCASLAVLAFGTAQQSLSISMWAVAVTAFCLLGPYSLLAGAVAMDMGGRKGTATAAGFIDTAGYIGGTLSGFAIGRLADAKGWAAVFIALSAVAALSVVIAGAYCVERRRGLRWQAALEVS